MLGKHQSKIWIASFVVVLVAYGLLGWYPQRSERSQLRNQIAQTQQNLAGDAADRLSIDKLEATVAELRQSTTDAQRLVPDQPELADLLRGLSDALIEQGVNGHEITTQPIEQLAHFQAIPISIEYRAPFTASYGVIEQIVSLPRLLRVDALHLMLDEGSENGVLEVNLRLSAFVAAPAEELSP